jgi:hypothetical protein
MSKEQDGGPAFPARKERYIAQELVVNYLPGMSLRDWFAGQAMPALMTNACAVFVSAAKSDSPEALKLAKAAYSESAIAAGAYALADAMLEAREK